MEKVRESNMETSSCASRSVLSRAMRGSQALMRDRREGGRGEVKKTWACLRRDVLRGFGGGWQRGDDVVLAGDIRRPHQGGDAPGMMWLPLKEGA